MKKTQVPQMRTARSSVQNSRGLIQINFLRASSELVRELIAADRRELDAMKQELALISNASLHIYERNGNLRFRSYDRDTKKRTGITNDIDTIHALARRTYLENRIAAIETNTRLLSDILDTTEGIRHEIRLRKTLKRYADSGLDLSRIIFTKEQNEWIDAPYTPDPFHPENLRYPTRGGIIMRSKSEAKIGNRLEAIGIPYRSDDLVTIQYGPDEIKPAKDTYFGDFKVPNLNGGITIHEHLGAFQMERYPDNALRRLNDYRDHTVFELSSRPVSSEEFTWSLEADLRSSRRFDRIIARMLLPGIN